MAQPIAPPPMIATSVVLWVLGMVWWLLGVWGMGFGYACVEGGWLWDGVGYGIGVNAGAVVLDVGV